MNKVEKIKAEIDRLQSSTLDENINFKSQYDQGIFDGLSLLENFIDSLEEEPVSNDLEKAAWTYYDKNKPLIPHELDLHKEMISFFIAGAQWQKEQNSTFINEVEWEDDIRKLFREKGKKVKLAIIKDENY